MIGEWLEKLPLVAILRGIQPDEALDVGQALIDCGFKIIEVPMNSPEPLESIRRLSSAFGGECLIGAGTVLQPEWVPQIAAHGGKLIVMPHADSNVITAAKRQRMHCIPGAATPTEAFSAIRAGADAVKLFPAEQLGPAVLKAWRAVISRDIALLPVGGITPESMASYIDAGASGFGLGSALYVPRRDLADIRRRARAFAEAWQAGTVSKGRHA